MAKAKIGVKNLHYAILTSDNASGVTYETPELIAGTINITIEHTTNSNTLYADDAPVAVATTYGGAKTSVELTDIPLDIQAKLLGNTYKDGVLRRKATDKAPYVAIMFESNLADGSVQYVKLLKGMFRIPKGEYSTKKDNVEFKTTTIEADFITREFDQAFEDTAYSDDESAAARVAAWYDSVEYPATTGDTDTNVTPTNP